MKKVQLLMKISNTCHKTVECETFICGIIHIPLSAIRPSTSISILRFSASLKSWQVRSLAYRNDREAFPSFIRFRNLIHRSYLYLGSD